jgi:hypothetical protein
VNGALVFAQFHRTAAERTFFRCRHDFCSR